MGAAITPRLIPEEEYNSVCAELKQLVKKGEMSGGSTTRSRYIRAADQTAGRSNGLI